MAQGAIRGPLIAVFPRLAMHAEGVIAGLLGVAHGALGLGDAHGMRGRDVVLMAGLAWKAGVRALGQFLANVVARGTIHLGRRGAGCPEKPEKKDEKGDPVHRANPDRRALHFTPSF
jgi:hypothetical protein